MRAMLTLYMVEELGFTKQTAIATFSYFSACVYFSPVLGGYIADSKLGKFSTILSFSCVYVLGISALAITSIKSLTWGMYLGLGLIALGSGGIKPCVSAFGAEQFGIGNFSPQDVSGYFMAFYASINIGSILSYIVTPFARRLAGYPIAFSISAVFLGLAIIVLVIPRKSYIHVPPTGSMLKEVIGSIFTACKQNGGVVQTCSKSCAAWRVSCCGGQKHSGSLSSSDRDESPMPLLTASTSVSVGMARESCESGADGADGAEANPAGSSGSATQHWMDAASGQYDQEVIGGAKAVLGVTPFFLALPMFWALFDQNGSAFTLQAKSMELYGLQPDNTLILNPALVLFLIPAYQKLIFPCIEKCGIKLTALRKIGFGMSLTGLSFVIAALVQTAIDAAASDGRKISIAWIVPQYVVITMSEILVSTIGQEWMFTQAPKSMKSTMMSMWFVSVGLGDLLAGVLYTALDDLPQQKFYWLFACLMAFAACVFVVLARAYTPVPEQPETSAKKAAPLPDCETSGSGTERDQLLKNGGSKVGTYQDGVLTGAD
mgnify:CR=1 FL=1